MKNLVLISLITIGIVIFSCSANAQTAFTQEIWNDNFDAEKEYKLSFIPTNKGCIDASNGNGAPCLKLRTGDLFIYENEYIGGSVKAARNEIYVVSADLMVQEYFSGPILAPTNYVSSQVAFQLALEGKNLLLDAYDKDGMEKKFFLGMITKNEFFNIKYVVNCKTRELKIFLNGERLLSENVIRISPDCENLVRLFRINNRNGIETIYMDNFSVCRDLMAERINFNDVTDAKDISLPQTDSGGNPLVWKSSKKDIITVDGRITAPIVKSTVCLTASCTLSGETQSRDYYITVFPTDDFDLEKYIDFKSCSTDNEYIYLPQYTINGLPIEWTSANNNIIDSNGNITRQYENSEINMVASVVYNNRNYSYDYTVTVTGYKYETQAYCISKSFSETGFQKGCKVNFSTDLFAPYAINGNLILTGFDANSKITECNITPVKFLAENSTHIQINHYLQKNCSYIKVFLWDSTSMKPIYKTNIHMCLMPEKMFAVMGNGLFVPQTDGGESVYDVNKNIFYRDDMTHSYNLERTGNGMIGAQIIDSLGKLYGQKIGAVYITEYGNNSDELNENIDQVSDYIQDKKFNCIIYCADTHSGEGEVYEQAVKLADFIVKLRNSIGNNIPVVICTAGKDEALKASLNDIPNLIKYCDYIDISESIAENSSDAVNDAAEKLKLCIENACK